MRQQSARGGFDEVQHFLEAVRTAVVRVRNLAHVLQRRKLEEQSQALVRGAKALGDIFWKIGDQRIIDGLGPNGFAFLSAMKVPVPCCESSTPRISNSRDARSTVFGLIARSTATCRTVGN